MIEAIVGGAGSVVLLLGLGLATIGLYGMLRHEDIFDQLHASGLVTGAGAILVLAASLASGSPEIATSALLVVAFILVTSSLSTHVVALAAWRDLEARPARAPRVMEAGPDGVPVAAPMRIVLAHDGSPGAELALALTTSLAWPAGTSVRVVVVTEGDLPPLSTVAETGSTRPAATTSGVAGVEGVDGADALAGRFARAGLAHDVVVRGGDPATVILDEADAVAADLVVVGSRGLGRVRSLLTGSVASAVIDRAPCPVLVARRPTVDTVLLATDGSAASTAAMDAVEHWPAFLPVTVHVLSVATAATGRQRKATEVAEAAVARLEAAGRRATANVRSGASAPQIVALAEERSADLIVLGTRGRSLLRRTLSGSVVREVFDASSVSVLVVRRRR